MPPLRITLDGKPYYQQNFILPLFCRVLNGFNRFCTSMSPPMAHTGLGGGEKKRRSEGRQLIQRLHHLPRLVIPELMWTIFSTDLTLIHPQDVACPIAISRYGVFTGFLGWPAREIPSPPLHSSSFSSPSPSPSSCSFSSSWPSCCSWQRWRGPWEDRKSNRKVHFFFNPHPKLSLNAACPKTWPHQGLSISLASE